MVFLLEVVSRPQREEKRLRRLLEGRGMAWLRLLTTLSVRAATCVRERSPGGQEGREGRAPGVVFRAPGECQAEAPCVLGPGCRHEARELVDLVKP